MENVRGLYFLLCLHYNNTVFVSHSIINTKFYCGIYTPLIVLPTNSSASASLH
jgi:hypothetical protein